MNPNAPTPLPTEEAILAETWFPSGEIREVKLETTPNQEPSLAESSTDDFDDADDDDLESSILEFNMRALRHNQICELRIAYIQSLLVKYL